MRIIHMLPSYTIISFWAICYPGAYVYLDGWVEVFQAIALFAFFMLLLEFLAPTDEEKFTFFGSLKIKKVLKKGKYREGVSFLKVCVNDRRKSREGIILTDIHLIAFLLLPIAVPNRSYSVRHR